MENLKIKVNNEAESNEVWMLLESIGLEPVMDRFSIGWIACDSKCFSSYPINVNSYADKCKEITIDQLRDMIVLKRNDVKDATHYDSFVNSEILKCILISDWWYLFTGGKWQQFCHIESGRAQYMKAISEKQMKEWIYKDGSGEYVLTTDLDVANLAADAVEVPIGAELYCFWHTDNEKAFHSESGFFIDDHWECSSWTLSEVKSGESGAKILWQRQPANETEYLLQGKNGDYLLESVVQLREDNVNHPSHYCGHPSGIECIEITRHHDFAIGNAIKYLWRAGLKGSDNEVQDLKKAVWYIQDKIKQLESKNVDDKTIDWIDEGNK